MSEQTNKLSSTDLLKVTFFIVLSVIGSLFFGVLAIPSIVTLVCYFMAKKHNSIGYIEASAKFYKIYYILALLFFAGTFINLLYDDSRRWSYYEEYYGRSVVECILFADFTSMIFLIVAIISIFYFMIVKPFFKVFENNKYVFQEKHEDVQKNSSIDIMGRDNMASYSVADELLKWKKLNDDGVISDSEFEDMKKKLLNTK